MKVFKQNNPAPDYIPLDNKSRPLIRNHLGYYSSTKMSSNGNKKTQSRYAGILDRNLVPRVKAYLGEKSHLRYIDVNQMADELQASYSDYGRKKKIPFRQMVNQGELALLLNSNRAELKFYFQPTRRFVQASQRMRVKMTAYLNRKRCSLCPRETLRMNR